MRRGEENKYGRKRRHHSFLYWKDILCTATMRGEQAVKTLFKPKIATVGFKYSFVDERNPQARHVRTTDRHCTPTWGTPEQKEKIHMS